MIGDYCETRVAQEVVFGLDHPILDSLGFELYCSPIFLCWCQGSAPALN